LLPTHSNDDAISLTAVGGAAREEIHMRFRPGIIVFAREPIPGMTKTRLASRIGANNAAALADAFARDAIAKARLLELPLLIAGSAADELRHNRYFRLLARQCKAVLVDQEQGHLGARMARVLAPLAQTGVLLIGTDTPSLPITILRHARELLRRNRVVIGPSLDGGYYLVGIRGAMPDMFRSIRWGGSRVLEETMARLTRAGIRPALAPSWYDVDRWSDLMLLTEHLRRQSRRGALPCPHTARVLVKLGLL
jgi:rSAM/selenodomain-associated transferase 1